jgi:hypothetical protein
LYSKFEFELSLAIKLCKSKVISAFNQVEVEVEAELGNLE